MESHNFSFMLMILIVAIFFAVVINSINRDLPLPANDQQISNVNYSTDSNISIDSSRDYQVSSGPQSPTSKYIAYVFGALVVIIGILMLVSYYYVKNKESRYSYLELELGSWIKQVIKDGYTDNQIRDFLKSKGFEDSDITEVIRKNKGLKI